MSAIGDVTVLEQDELALSSGLDQVNAGLTFVIELDDMRVRVDALHFQSGTVGGMLFMMYPQAEQPSVTLDRLVLTMANRLFK